MPSSSAGLGLRRWLRTPLRSPRRVAAHLARPGGEEPVIWSCRNYGTSRLGSTVSPALATACVGLAGRTWELCGAEMTRRISRRHKMV